MRRLKRVEQETKQNLNNRVRLHRETSTRYHRDMVDTGWSRLHGVDTSDTGRHHNDDNDNNCESHNYSTHINGRLDSFRLTTYRCRSSKEKHTRYAITPHDNANSSSHRNQGNNNMILFQSSPDSYLARRRRTTSSSLLSLPSVTRFSFFTSLLLTVAIIAYHYDHHYAVDCLDSPVRIQRNKQQQPKHIIANNITVSELSTRQNIARVESSSTFGATSSEQLDGGYPQFPRENRVRRTNEISGQVSRRPTTTIECPSKRLMQSLLPPEYVGSPAMQAGQRQSRGSCDCELDPDQSGWRITCAAGDESTLLLMNSNADGRQIRLPNQLHPAFRGPQMKRHKQQQQVSNVPAAMGVNRRVNRSPTRWMGEDLVPPSGHSSSSSSGSTAAEPSGSDVSVHEGFGEETNAQTTPRPGIRSRTMSNNSSSNDGFNQAASADSDSILSLPSSASFSMVMQGEHNNNNNRSHSSEDKESPRSAAASDNNEKLINQNNHNSNNNNDHHLMYETVPVLFSVKYTRTKNMIEIDCDKAAPNYKAAMFQGK